MRPLRLRYWLWVFEAFVRRHFLLFIGGILGGILLAIMFVFLPKSNQRLSIGMVGVFQQDSLPLEVIEKMSGGLTKVGPDGQPLPGMASSWSISPDSTVYKFYLLPNLKWSDGSPVKASQLNYHFQDARMRAISSSVVEVTLKESYTPFPVIVDRPLFKEGFVGIGPYRLSGVRSAGSQLLEVDLVAEQGSGMADLAYHFYPTEAAALTGWKVGEVSRVEDLSSMPLPGWHANVTKTVRTDRFVGLFFNTQDSAVGDKTFRQAIAYAIKDKVPSGAERAIGPISPQSWAYNPNLKTYDYNLPHAKDLLNQVGTASGSLRLTLSTFPELLPMANLVKQDLKDLGLNVEIKVVSGLPDSFQMLLVTEAIPQDPDQYDLWHSSQVSGSNFTRLNQPKIDKLLADGRKTEGMTRRRPIYLDFQKTLVEETPAVFLYHPISYTLSR